MKIIQTCQNDYFKTIEKFDLNFIDILFTIDIILIDKKYFYDFLTEFYIKFKMSKELHIHVLNQEIENFLKYEEGKQF